MFTIFRAAVSPFCLGLILTLASPSMAAAQSASTTAAPISAAQSNALSRLTKAQGKLADANRDIAAATNKQATASAAGTIAAADFRAVTASVPVFNSSADAKAWAGKVSDAAARWTKADKTGTKGGKQLANAIKRQKKAQEDILRTQSEVDMLRP
jgi:hypothetical protein